MPPKRDAYIGPPRAATPPPAEGRGCSSFRGCPGSFPWNARSSHQSNKEPSVQFRPNPSEPPDLTEPNPWFSRIFIPDRLLLVVASCGLGQPRKNVLI
jgi:hypothetical protein